MCFVSVFQYCVFQYCLTPMMITLILAICVVVFFFRSLPNKDVFKVYGTGVLAMVQTFAGRVLSQRTGLPPGARFIVNA